MIGLYLPAGFQCGDVSIGELDRLRIQNEVSFEFTHSHAEFEELVSKRGAKTSNEHFANTALAFAPQGTIGRCLLAYRLPLRKAGLRKVQKMILDRPFESLVVS